MRHALGAFLRASSLHIGAAAATAALREELVADRRLEAHEIDTAYAVSRITPGTNLLALYAQLGHRIGGWPLAFQAVAVGAFVPAVLAVIIAALYWHSSGASVEALMKGARAGGVAVFVGAAVRIMRPQMVARPRIATGLALAAVAASLFVPISAFLVLVFAGLAGALLLRPR